MIEISAELNRVLFDAIHAIVGMACDRGVYRPDCGLCLNVERWVDVHHPYYRTVDFYRLLGSIFKGMGLAQSYPVPYPHVGGLWDGSQFRLRMDLCSKLMSYLDIQLVYLEAIQNEST